jgi:hypothetical protein
MDALSRRTVLAGMGAAATAVGAIGVAGTAGASPAPSGGGFGDGASPAPAAGAVLEPEALTPGLTYVNLDPIAFTPIDFTQGRVIDVRGFAALATPMGGGLFSPIILAVGSVIKEITLSYIVPTPGPRFQVWRRPVGAAYTRIVDMPITAGAGVQSQMATITADVNETTTYMVMLNPITTTAQAVVDALVGYTPPPQAFVPLNPVPRVLDTRVTGGKLQNNEERVVALGVPGFAKAAVINLTVTETELAGFVAVFGANVLWPGNSSVNWSVTGQNLANGVITAIDPSGKIKIRGGVNPTHVVIDVQGYLL